MLNLNFKVRFSFKSFDIIDSFLVFISWKILQNHILQIQYNKYKLTSSFVFKYLNIVDFHIHYLK